MPAHITDDMVQRTIPLLKQRIREIQALDLNALAQDRAEGSAVLDLIDSNLSHLFGHGTSDYNKWRISSLFGLTAKSGTEAAIERLQACVRMLERRFPQRITGDRLIGEATDKLSPMSVSTSFPLWAKKLMRRALGLHTIGTQARTVPSLQSQLHQRLTA